MKLSKVCNVLREPFLFNRASRLSVIKPEFQLKSLEEKFLKHFSPLRRQIFKLALVYLLVKSLSWCINYFIVDFPSLVVYASFQLMFFVMCFSFLLLLSFRKKLSISSCLWFSRVICIFLIFLDLSVFMYNPARYSVFSIHANTFEFHLLAYTLLFLELPEKVLLAIFLFVAVEILLFCRTFHFPAYWIFGKVLMHLAFHFIGILLFFSLHSCTRRAFYNSSQMLFLANQVKSESHVINKMIDSIMPHKIAVKVKNDIDKFRKSLKPRGIDENNDDECDTNLLANEKRRKQQDSEYIIFRPFVINRMSEVSILFADIVGFTQMSSNKTASNLVELLSDLYGRFDRLVELTGCEKIATLGDCYYCVSGCPYSRTDHAKCCVEMGLLMIDAIQQFDKDNNEQVQMRVGIHTGSVNCGIIGVHKFRFDIFSNDVTLANKMESTGLPGYVHITESTLQRLPFDVYVIEDADPLEFQNQVYKTYLIKERTGGSFTVAQAAVDTYKMPEPDVNDVAPQPSAFLMEIIRHRRLTSASLENATEISSKLSERLLEIDKQISDFIEPIQLDFECENLNKLTLRFRNEMENDFWKLFNNLDYCLKPFVFSHPAVNFLFYMIVSTIFFALMVLMGLTNPHIRSVNIWIPLSTFCVILEILITIVLTVCIFKHDLNMRGSIISFMSHYLTFVFVLLPILLPFLLFRCELISSDAINPNWAVLTMGSASLFHLCLFPYILFFVKVLIASLTTIGWLIVLYSAFCRASFHDKYRISSVNVTVNQKLAVQWIHNGSTEFDNMLSFILILILVVFIIREYDLVYRKLFFTEKKGAIQKREVETEKERADWLLRNIIPEFVIDPLLKNHRYAKDYTCVGVAFVTLTNYLTELYEEQFEGGQFYGRVLNEFFADIDAMLLKHAKKLEKIKTIGPTYMLASGLNPICEDSTDHLYTLMDFVIEFKRAAERFSQDLFNFKFIVRGGYNFGPVTAGVIGTNRLMYDIWGDTVNVASRMDSKGIDNRIQVPKHVAEAFQSRYKFSYRGSVYIKGKDMMDTYLLEE